MARIAAFLSLGAFVVVAGLACSPAGPKVPDQISVKGEVKVEGKPVVDGEIGFSKEGQPGRFAPIKDGSYSGQAYEGVNKVTIKVWEAGPPDPLDKENKPTKKDSLGGKYDMKSDLKTGEVKKGDANVFNFDVKR